MLPLRSAEEVEVTVSSSGKGLPPDRH